MQGADPKLIDALSRATSLELFQLSMIIERMLADPQRIIAVRANMHLGQTVRFLDYRDGQMRTLLMAELNAKPSRLVPVLHFDGTPITARFIAGAITRHVHAEIVAPKADKASKPPKETVK
mgnify:CR=1 FL=1